MHLAGRRGAAGIGRLGVAVVAAAVAVTGVVALLLPGGMAVLAVVGAAPLVGLVPGGGGAGLGQVEGQVPRSTFMVEGKDTSGVSF